MGSMLLVNDPRSVPDARHHQHRLAPRLAPSLANVYAAQSRTLKRILLEQLKRDELKSFFLSGFEVDEGRHPCPLGLSPSCGAETPSVTGLESRKAVHGSGRAQVITSSTGVGKKVLRHLCTDDVHTSIIRTSMTKTIALKAR